MYLLGLILALLISAVNSQEGISLDEQNGIKFLNAYYGYYPSYDSISLCPTDTSQSGADKVTCNNDSLSYYVYSLKYSQLGTFNTSIIPDSVALPLNFPRLTSMGLDRAVTFNNNWNPLGFFGNISSVNTISITFNYTDNGPMLPKSFPSIPLESLGSLVLRFTYISLQSPIEPYNYNFTSYFYPKLKSLTLFEFPNGTFYMDTPNLFSISFSGKSGDFVITTAAPGFRIVKQDTTITNHEFILNGLTLFKQLNNFGIYRETNRPTLISIDGKTLLKYDDFPYFYLPITNTTIPEFLFCNPKLNLTYLPTGYSTYVNQSRMCGATIETITYFVKSDSIITITGENLFYIKQLLSKVTYKFQQIDHSDGLIEIEKFKKYEYTIASLNRSGTENIIFSRFNGISFNIEWYRDYFIKNVTFTNALDKVNWKLYGLFNVTNNTIIKIDETECNITIFGPNLLYCTTPDIIPSGNYTINITNGYDEYLHFSFPYIRAPKPTISITKITTTQIFSGYKIFIYGDFSNYNHILYINGTSVQMTLFTPTLITANIYPALKDGVALNVTLVNYAISVTNFSTVVWDYPSITKSKNDGLDLVVSGNFGPNLLFIRINVDGVMCTLDSSATNSISCILSTIIPKGSSNITLTVDGFQKSFFIPIVCDCDNVSGYCNTHNLCDSVTTNPSTTSITSPSDTPNPTISSSSILKRNMKYTILLSSIMIIFSLNLFIF